MGVALLATLSGCGKEESPLRFVIEAVRGEDYALSEEEVRELDRFNEVYYEYAVAAAGDKQLKHFRDAFKRVRSKYVHEISDVKLIDEAIKGVGELKAEPHTVAPPKLVEAALDTMLASLDPHSRYLNAEELETHLNTKGEFGGLGIQVTLEDELIKVISPIEDTPAYRAGIKAGDLITHLDGDPIKGKPLMYSVNRMRGRPGTDIRLTVVREGGDPFDVAITRAIIKIESVRWRTEGDIGYIRVTNFNEKVAENVEKAMLDIDKRLASRLKGVVLDLRNNPGGLLMQSVALSDAFLEKGRIVSVLGRVPRNNSIFEARSGDLADGLPMVVLINGGSASASEIVASALQDHHRAIVMGRRSFGKGSVQTISPLPIEGALKLTTQLYYSPSGRAIQAHGVAPDILLTVKDEGKDKDKRQREADLPGALPAVSKGQTQTSAALEETDCPSVVVKGDKKDYQLGCALALLSAGSTENFLASIGARPSM